MPGANFPFLCAVVSVGVYLTLPMTLHTRPSLTSVVSRLWTFVQSTVGTMITETFRKRRMSDHDEVSASDISLPTLYTMFVVH